MPKTQKTKTKRSSVKNTVVKTKPISRGVKTSPPHAPSQIHQTPQETLSLQSAPISIPVFGIDGAQKGKMQLPGAFFSANVNPPLVAQAVRVYLANQRAGGASTKTRGDVEGSSRKIYRQKGTGRARHGAVRAPIFVGGGVTFGPLRRDYRLDMPQKMKRAALASALTTKREKQNVIVIDGLATLEPKTKAMASALEKTAGEAKSILLVITKDVKTVTRAARNIEGVDVLLVQNLHCYDVLSHEKIVFMKESILSLPRQSDGKTMSH